MNNDLTYLATPFTHPDVDIMEHRFAVINKIASEMMCQGEHVFSPISHCYPIAKAGKLPVDWEFWQHYCRKTLKNCTKFLVVMQDGWEDSVGLKAEMKIAEEMGIPISFRKP